MYTILQINSAINYGSTGHIAEEIGLHTIHQGWLSYIAYGRSFRPSKSNLIKIGTDWDVLKHGIQTRLFDRQGFGSKHATKELVNRIKEIKPDLIHLHNMHGYYLNIEILFNFLADLNIPIVWTLHDCWALTGHCAHFDSVSCYKWQTGCYSCPLKKDYTSSFFLDNSKMNYREKCYLFNSVSNLTIVPVSSWLGDVLNNSYLKDYPSQVINNGVDLKVFIPQKNGGQVRTKLGVGDRFMVIGVASRWSQNKGWDDYMALSKLIDPDTVIVLVGLTKKMMIDLPSNIIGIPRTDNVFQLVDIYSAADMVFNLSITESFGLTTVEGLACGTPGVVYNSTASPELISSDTGFIVEKGDLSSLLNIINIVKKKGKSAFTKACRDRAEKIYNMDERYKDYIMLYDKLLSETKR